MRPPRNSPWWSSCMLSSARHFSLGKRHFLLGFWHFSLGWCVCNSLCHNGLQEMSFPNRLNNRLKKSIGDYAMLRPYASWKMDWKVVERGIGDSVSLLGNQRYSVPKVCRWWPRGFAVVGKDFPLPKNDVRIPTLPQTTGKDCLSHIVVAQGEMETLPNSPVFLMII